MNQQEQNMIYVNLQGQTCLMPICSSHDLVVLQQRQLFIEKSQEEGSKVSPATDPTGKSAQTSASTVAKSCDLMTGCRLHLTRLS